MLLTGINKRIGYHKEAQNVVFFIAVVAQKCNRTYQLIYFFWGGLDGGGGAHQVWWAI